MFVLKNGHDLQLSGANCHAKLGNSKQLLKNIHPVTLAQALYTVSGKRCHSIFAYNFGKF